MRVLVISDLYPPVAFGGYEIDCASFVRAINQDHEVLVLTSELDRDSAPAEQDVLRELPWAGGSRLRATARAPWAAARAAKLVRRVLAEFDPDLVYVSNSVDIPQAALATAAGDGRVMAYRLAETFFATNLFRGDRFLRHFYPGEKGLLRAWGAVARTVNRLHPALRVDPHRASRAAVSWASRDLSLRAPLPPSIDLLLERVIYPTSAQAASFADLERRTGETPTILYLGRVNTGKGAEVALRALAIVRREYEPRARLSFIGHHDPAGKAALESLASELGVEDAVELRGRRPLEEIGQALSSAHVLLVPSIVPDVFPLVVIEGAQARIPIVASRTGGIPEALDDESEALLFEPGDADDCARALAATFAEPSAAEERAKRAFSRMQALTPERYERECRDFVSEAVEALSPPRAA